MNRAERRRDAKRGQQIRRAGEQPAPTFARAVASFGGGDLDRAETLFQRCLDAGLDVARARHNLGVIAGLRGRHAEAAALFRTATALAPSDAEAWMNLGLSLAETGDLRDGRAAVERAVALDPAGPAPRTALAEILMREPDLHGAQRACQDALAADPLYGPALLRRAKILRESGDHEGLVAHCDDWLARVPGATAALLERAAALLRLDCVAEAEADLVAALAAEGHGGSACLALSALLADDDRPDEAVALLGRAVEARPDHAMALMNRAVLNQRAGRFEAALADFRRTLELAPDDARAYHNVGYMLLRVEQPDTAIPFLEHAIRLKPDLVDSLLYLAEAYRQLSDYATASAVLEHAAELAPERPNLRIALCWSRMHACDWRGFGDSLRDDLARCIAAGEPFSPFILMAMGLSNLETLLWTRAWTQQNLDAKPTPLDRPKPIRPRNRIRIGYLSADFRGHATAVLVMALFELHDRERFEIYGYNIGRGDGSAMGQRMTAALDHLVDLSFLGDRDAAQRIADDAIDVLIDMKGFTTDSRPNILSFRPAPIQVNYLGFPGTMGTPHVDYVVVDAVVAPRDHQPFYDEKIVHLPHCYQPNDRDRPGADPAARRADHGLPERGFVFCCFNNNYKITPLIFDIWMRLLAAVDGSVLWLLEANPQASRNLKEEAAARGVARERIVFAPPRVYADHMARIGLADLFLDTLPVNAHTTASDSLWAGVPVLTCLGPYFPGRVAASLLGAVGLPELVTACFADYETEALALARDPARLSGIRDKLAADRATAPLFDTPRYIRDYEAALERMVEIHDAGRSPEAFAVSETARPPMEPPSPAPSTSPAHPYGTNFQDDSSSMPFSGATQRSQRRI